MSDPFRLRVMKALTTALEEINPDNGYTYDLRGKVFRGRDMFGDSDPLPLVSILEAIDEKAQMPTPEGGAELAGPWELLIQGFLDDDIRHPTDPAYGLVADVRKRLVQERVRERQYNILGMGGKVTDLRLSPGVVRPPDEVSAKAYFWLRLTLDLVENLSAPYD